jgi:hypothetical protein
MPRAAIALEGFDQVAALDDICRLLLAAHGWPKRRGVPQG